MLLAAGIQKRCPMLKISLTWPAKECRIIAFWSVFRGLGSLFYILSGSRYFQTLEASSALGLFTKGTMFPMSLAPGRTPSKGTIITMIYSLKGLTLLNGSFEEAPKPKGTTLTASPYLGLRPVFVAEAMSFGLTRNSWVPAVRLRFIKLL